MNRNTYFFGRCPILYDKEYFRDLKLEEALQSLDNYEHFLFDIKDELFNKIMKNDFVQKIFVYNNQGVERIKRHKIDIKAFPNSKKENGIIKTLTAYIYRAMFKATYGAFSNFYTKITLTDFECKKSKIGIVYTIENNTDAKKQTYINPCHKTIGEKHIFFNIKNGANSIIALDNTQYSLLNDVVSDPGNPEYYYTKKMFLNAGILKEDFNSISAIKSSAQHIKALKSENLEHSRIYNCINEFSFCITVKDLDPIIKAKNVYLGFLEKQFEHFAYEKQCIIKKITQQTNPVNLLEFVLDNLDLIDNLYEERKKFNSYFLEKLGVYSKKFNCTVEQISIPCPYEFKTNKQTEAYVSRFHISDKLYVFIDAMSPSGVFSSRINLNFGIIKENRDTFLECVYNPDESMMNFHAFKRNNTYQDILNINCYDDIQTESIANIAIVCLEVINNEIFLRLPNKDKLYEPVFHTTIPNGEFIVTRFLKMISSYQEEIYSLPSVEPYFDQDNDYLPRIVCGDLILQKRVWKVSTKDIKIIRNTPLVKYENFVNITKYRQNRGIPRYISVFQRFNDNKRIIDLNNPYSVAQLRTFLDGTQNFFIEEILPSPESIYDAGESNELFTQILI